MLLIINADDVGYCSERDKGIFECVKFGSVSSVSFMVNGCNVESAAKECKTLIKETNLCVGLHINLTEGKPIHGNVPSLINAIDNNMKGKMGFRTDFENNLIKKEDIINEINTQFNLFESLLGFLPHHIDTHQHTHQIPSLAEIIIPILQERKIKSVRLPTQSSKYLNDISSFLLSVHHQALISKQQYLDAGFFMPNSFIGLNLMGCGTIEKLENEIDAITSTENINFPYYIEWMCHPGYICNLEDDFTGSSEREDELNLLLSTQLLELLKRKNIKIEKW